MLGVNIAILLPTVLSQVHKKTELETRVQCYGFALRYTRRAKE